MPNVSIALVKEINKRLASPASRNVAARSSRLSQQAINAMLKKAYDRLNR
ncbi:hypothetical protein [Pseudomonas gingeri]|nr:hypothetical protein [Pseudomonas gingeri]NVZ30224.1 hypothetical protein [Pseudomonas gingeri]NWA10455.1 hypothetical protein [Pseudomonas gingeri]NWE47047.1 hypothetical protein [Pseudomonas gingeri]NWE69357.1 hypothetical protein [Pseudomonas gingeri]